MSVTDADILALVARPPRPSLYDRAVAAHWAAKDAEDAAKAQEVADLREDAVTMMREVLGMLPDEVDEALRALRVGSHNTERMKVEFDVEKWHFRVRYAIEPIKVGKSDSTHEVVGYDFKPVYEVRPRQASQWREFEKLEDIVSGMGVGVRPS